MSCRLCSRRLVSSGIPSRGIRVPGLRACCSVRAAVSCKGGEALAFRSWSLQGLREVSRVRRGRLLAVRGSGRAAACVKAIPGPEREGRVGERGTGDSGGRFGAGEQHVGCAVREFAFPDAFLPRSGFDMEPREPGMSDYVRHVGVGSSEGGPPGRHCSTPGVPALSGLCCVGERPTVQKDSSHRQTVSHCASSQYLYRIFTDSSKVPGKMAGG